MRTQLLLAALATSPAFSSASVIEGRQIVNISCPFPGEIHCGTRTSGATTVGAQGEQWLGRCTADFQMQLIENCSAKRFPNGKVGCCGQDPASTTRKAICAQCS